MPIIKVWCLPEMDEDKLHNLHNNIVSAVCGIKELGLTDENDMTCLYPSDKMKYGLGKDIVVEISGLFEKPERTPDVIDRLAHDVGCTVSAHFPKAKVECFISLFNPACAFWTSDRSGYHGYHSDVLDGSQPESACFSGMRSEGTPPPGTS